MSSQEAREMFQEDSASWLINLPHVVHRGSGMQELRNDPIISSEWLTAMIMTVLTGAAAACLVLRLDITSFSEKLNKSHT